MRLEEWFKHVESFEHSTGKQAGSAYAPVTEEHEEPVSIESIPEPAPAAAVRRFSPQLGEEATFRAVAPPVAPPRGFAQTPRVPKRRVGLGAVFSVQKESREQLLARLLDPVLTLEETAQVLNVCPTTVRRYTNKGLLQHYRTSGNQRRFRLSHVLNFLGEVGGSLEKGTLTETLEPAGAKPSDRVRPMHRSAVRS
jgi:excisionase family DNA binding protein